MFCRKPRTRVASLPAKPVVVRGAAGGRLPDAVTASTAATNNASTPSPIWIYGPETSAFPTGETRSTNSSVRPRLSPIAKAPHRNTKSCNNGRGRFSIRTVRPSRVGSTLTPMAISSTMVHMTTAQAQRHSVRRPARTSTSRGLRNG
ncbi:Uncharacterised protein [Mycobacteroides abscessus subsp. abscessus]|nr:Uncharacterised protein [Mycobacteroides abscessus subsp. abscessus]